MGLDERKMEPPELTGGIEDGSTHGVVGEMGKCSSKCKNQGEELAARAHHQSVQVGKKAGAEVLGKGPVGPSVNSPLLLLFLSTVHNSTPRFSDRAADR
jgi:hypothetical protein